MIARIEQILGEKVRPALEAHNGDVRIVDYSDGTLHIELLGQCSNCPAAHLTTEMLITREIKSLLPEVKNVILVQSVSDDMMEMAHKILNHNL